MSFIVLLPSHKHTLLFRIMNRNKVQQLSEYSQFLTRVFENNKQKKIAEFEKYPLIIYIYSVHHKLKQMKIKVGKFESLNLIEKLIEKLGELCIDKISRDMVIIRSSITQ